jgi:hypothetical protein
MWVLRGINEGIRSERGFFECGDIIKDIEQSAGTPCLGAAGVMAVGAILVCAASEISQLLLSSKVQGEHPTVLAGRAMHHYG